MYLLQSHLRLLPELLLSQNLRLHNRSVHYNPHESIHSRIHLYCSAEFRLPHLKSDLHLNLHQNEDLILMTHNRSVVIGDVTIGRDSCVLHYAVIRGDDAPIVIGEESNVQENCTIHVSRNMPVHIGNNVTVGHNAVLHGCMIGDRTLIGMGAVVLDGARIGKDCIIGAGSLVTKNTVIPDGSLVMGSPAKIKRNLTWEEKLGNLENSKEYVSVSAEMQKQGVL